ncbi:NAD(P)-binding protein [Periconia macrospinosa]|uniref:NAD(P)-binding protein n=1 Tax=Periconia macrospinosa TaxID=97972 RepID=A0A2V1DF89_9PLEO|nr:NAD(P)-binding protein [Periconia macrospinosa]
MSTFQRLTNRVAIVTGSSSGIGRAICKRFHAEGAFLVCADLRSSPLVDSDKQFPVPTHELIVQAGGKAIFVATDVSLASDMEGLISTAVREYGRVDIIVNNAAIYPEIKAPTNPINASSIDNFEKTIRVNTMGAFLGAKYAVDQMKKQQRLACGVRGWILNVASTAAIVGVAGLPGYTASKGAIMAMTRSTAIDVAKNGIICNTIVPGFTDETAGLELAYNGFLKGLQPQDLAASIPLKRLGRPEDIAGAAVFLVSDDAAWVTGTSLLVDGGSLICATSAA